MAQESFERTLEVYASRSTAWALLIDMDRVTSWVSVIGAVRQVQPLALYYVVLADRLGPFRLRADLTVSVSNVEEPVTLDVHVQGEDRQIASRIEVFATLNLRALETTTLIDVRGQ